MKRKILAVIVCMCLVMGGGSGGASASSSPFWDVNENHWAYDAIQTFYQGGIVAGVGEGQFAPNSSVTREEFAKMLVLTFHVTPDSSGESSFGDVPSDRWSSPYIEKSKEFLTGYANPFGEKPLYNPSIPASREDIAVALVKMMGLPEDDSNGYVQSHFSDAGSISPGLVKYVNTAAKEGLIKGYTDGAFRPSSPVTRAEAVSLLYRASKQSVSDIGSELKLYAESKQEEEGKFSVYILTERGASLTVDGAPIAPIDMKDYGYDLYGGVIKYHFTEEGVKSFQIKASRAGKTREISHSITYRKAAPILEVDSVPESVSSNTVTITGRASDKNDSSPKIYMNGTYLESGDFRTTVTLNAGENVFVFRAVNKDGIESETVTKTIFFNLGGPKLVIDPIPETTSVKTVTITGRASDQNDSNPKIYMNGEYLDYSSFRKTVTLKEGKNVFTFRAVNRLGKESEPVTRTIVFGVDGPTLTIDPTPEKTSVKTVTITGRASDKNDGSPKIYMNGEYLDYSSFRKTVSLKEGENLFTFRAVNNLGKESAEITKTIVFGVEGPSLTIDPVPEVTSVKTVTITGRASDKNDSSPKIYMNGQYLDYSSFRKTVELTEGNNTFTFQAVNSLGKESETVTKTVRFDVGAPTLKIDPVPEVVHTKTVTITGRASDKNDSSPKIYMNGQYVDYSSFRKTVSLNDGENVLTFQASNQLGKTTSQKVTVIYEPQLDD